MRVELRGQPNTIPVDAMFHQEIPFSNRGSPVVRRRKSRWKRTKRCPSWRPLSPHLEVRKVLTQTLLDVLKMARAQSKVSPVRERMESCQKFIERAKKCVMRAEDLITKATEQKAVFLQVKEAEERLKQLESEAAAPASSEPVVADLQRQIDALILERDSMQKTMPGEWCSDGLPKLEAIPPAHAHFGSSRSRNVAQQSELRVEECVGVWGYRDHCQGWRSGGSGQHSFHSRRWRQWKAQRGQH